MSIYFFTLNTLPCSEWLMMLIEKDHYHTIRLSAVCWPGSYLGSLECGQSEGGGDWASLAIISSSDGKTFPVCSLMFLSLWPGRGAVLYRRGGGGLSSANYCCYSDTELRLSHLLRSSPSRRVQSWPPSLRSPRSCRCPRWAWRGGWCPVRRATPGTCWADWRTRGWRQDWFCCPGRPTSDTDRKTGGDPGWTPSSAAERGVRGARGGNIEWLTCRLCKPLSSPLARLSWWCLWREGSEHLMIRPTTIPSRIIVRIVPGSTSMSTWIQMTQ